jgi:hypothetical protein
VVYEVILSAVWVGVLIAVLVGVEMVFTLFTYETGHL